MNENYVRYHITGSGQKVPQADWFYNQHELALERGNLFIGFAELTIGSTSTAHLHMTTGSTKNVTFIGYNLASDSPETVEEIIEAPTLTQGTTELAVYNANRQLDTAPDFTIYTDSTYTSGGTIIYADQKFEAKKATSSIVAGDYGRIRFKKDEDYMLAIENADNSQHTFFARFYFHESA